MLATFSASIYTKIKIPICFQLLDLASSQTDNGGIAYIIPAFLWENFSSRHGVWAASGATLLYITLFFFDSCGIRIPWIRIRGMSCGPLFFFLFSFLIFGRGGGSGKIGRGYGMHVPRAGL